MKEQNYLDCLVGVFGHPAAENPGVVIQEAAFRDMELPLWRFLTIDVDPDHVTLAVSPEARPLVRLAVAVPIDGPGRQVPVGVANALGGFRDALGVTRTRPRFSRRSRVISDFGGSRNNGLTRFFHLDHGSRLFTDAIPCARRILQADKPGGALTIPVPTIDISRAGGRPRTRNN